MTKIREYMKNILRNLPLVISGCGWFALQTTSFSALARSAVMAVLLLVVAGFVKNAGSFWKANLSAASVSLSLCTIGLSGFLFCFSMVNSSKVRAVAQWMGISSKWLVLAVGLIGCATAFYFITLLTEYILLKAEGGSSKICFRPKGDRPVSKRELLVLLASAAAIIAICSKSSPLYPLNDWVDSNCFFTVGKAMLHGKVPYRDLFEQKGPLLYMLHALAALVSERSFLGVYFLEVLACGAFLFYSLKIVRLYYPHASVCLMPVLAAVLYSTPSFCHGDSAEELCLPFFAFALYVGLKSLHRKTVPTHWECMAIGMTAACVLWIKFSMLGFYIGWICVPAVLLIKKKKWAELFQMLLRIILGVLITSLPILIYFAANHALNDLWTVYFYDNLFYYSSAQSNSGYFFSLIRNLCIGVVCMLQFNLISVLLTATGLIFLPKKQEKADFWFIFTTMAGTVLLVFIGGRYYPYYPFVFSAFAPIGMAVVGGFLETALNKCKLRELPAVQKGMGCVVCILCAVFAFFQSDNTYLMEYEKSEMPQYRFAEIIAQKENATLLNYGFLDGGFYTATGIVPSCKYFCALNIPMEEIAETQNAYVAGGKVDFVVTRNTELSLELYECVAEETFYFEGSDWQYRLYQLVQ